MPVISKSVRAGIAAMLVTPTGTTAMAPSAEPAESNGTFHSEVLLARSGYIVVAG